MCLMWRLGRNPTGIRRPERRRGPDDEPVARLVNCGHPAPLLLRAGQVREAEPSAPSPPINLAWLVGGEYHVDVVPFAGGDTMLLYTDGVSEARDRTGAFYPLMRRLRDCGIPEIVVKKGADGCLLWDGMESREIPADTVPRVVDSTAAGDAFNAGYLAARLASAPPAEAARRAHSVAAQVIQHPGAIVGEAVLARRP